MPTKSWFEQEAPKIGAQKCSTKRGVREPLNVEFFWGRAKGAAKASCGETVVQKGVFGESVSSLPPQGFQDLSGVLRANLKGAEKKRTLPKTPFWTTVSLHDAFAAPLAHSEICPE